jgi:hypothetical protein
MCNIGENSNQVYFLYLAGGLAGNVAYLAHEYYRITSAHCSMHSARYQMS